MTYVHLPLTLAVIVWTSACAASSRICAQEGERVTLHGTVSERQVYGPPNFGDTPEVDQRRTVRILTLSEPIDLCARQGSHAGEPAELHVNEVQLIAPTARATAEPERVLTGVLARSDNALHYTRVIFILD